MHDQHPDATACRLKISIVSAASRAYMPLPWNEVEEYLKYVKHSGLISAECRLPLIEEEYFLSKSDPSVEDIQNRRSVVSAVRKREESFDILIPRPVLAKTFDEHIDTTCVELTPHDINTMATAGAMALANYSPPSAALGSGTLRFLNKLLESKQLSLTGITSKGSSTASYNGFILCYELLCDQLDLKILKDDKPRNLGCLLARAIPAKETIKTGLMASIIRVIIWNPDVAGTLPGYHAELLKAKLESEKKDVKDSKSSSMLSRITEKISGALDVAKFNIRFLEGTAENLFVANSLPREAGAHPLGSLQWPTIKKLYVPNDRLRTNTAAISDVDNKALKLYHGLSIPSIAENSSSERIFAPIPLEKVQVSGVSLSFDCKAILAFSDLPMSPLGLESLVRNAHVVLAHKDVVVEGDDGDENVSKFYEKFRIAGSSSCTSTRAQSTVKRLARDLDLVRQIERSTSQPEMTWLSQDQVQLLLQNPSTIDDTILKLEGLLKKLLSMHASDSQMSQKSIDECLSVICFVFDSEANHSLFNLSHEAGQAPQCSFESAASLLLDKNTLERFKDYNPYITSDTAAVAENLLVGAMLSLNRSGQAARCISTLNEILDLFRKARRSSIEEKDDSLLNSISFKSSALTEMLCAKRGYTTVQKSSEDLLSVTYDPRFLVFEFISNIMLRKSQIKLVQRFISAFYKKEKPCLCHQLIMGAGKTTVIAPLLALMLGTTERLVVQVFFS